MAEQVGLLSKKNKEKMLAIIKERMDKGIL